VSRLPPFPEDFGQVAVRHHPGVHAAHDDVMSLSVTDSFVAVAGDTRLLDVPVAIQPYDRIMRHARQVQHDPRRMLPGDLDFTGEAQVVTNQDLTPRNNARTEGHVVRIAHADDFMRFMAGVIVGDLKKPEVAMAVFGESMRLFDHTKSAFK